MAVEETASTALRDGVVMLGAALVFVSLFRRAGLGATLGYIVAGAFIGPQILGLVDGAEGKMHVADYGIVLLLFLVGLELHPSRLWRLKRDIFGLGLAQVVLSGIAISALIHFGAGFTLGASLAIGLPLALSSTAQVLPALRADGELNTPFGERAFSVLLFQDLSIVPLITIIAALSRAPDAGAGPPGWLLGLYTVGAIVGLVLAGRYIINPAFRLIGRFGEREMFVVAGLFTVLAASAVMQALGLSTALGAFIAGVMLAESPYRHELESDIDPFRSILLGLFFLSVGMLLDLNVLVDRPLFIISMAAGVIAIKTAVLFGLARLFGMSPGRAITLGLLLSQGGEFGFVLFAQATNAALITPEGASVFGAVVTLSMATTPFLMRLIDRVDDRLDAREAELDGPEHSGETNAIVVGYGRFGQTVSQMLMARNIPVTIIDSKPDQIELSSTFGQKVFYGDGKRVDLLRTAGAETAEAIIFCQDGTDLEKATIEPILEAFPQAAVLVRAYDRRHVIALDGVDVVGIYREVFESAVVMGRDALVALNVPRREVDGIEREYRRRDSDRLIAQSRTGDLHAEKETIFTPDNRFEAETDPA
ncbi:MAG TPA: cation:proton antiporter [Sphingomonadaceae bacterium]|nr:cation:proton antiporter [Sphingomonadaceae bacterium]